MTCSVGVPLAAEYWNFPNSRRPSPDHGNSGIGQAPASAGWGQTLNHRQQRLGHPPFDDDEAYFSTGETWHTDR